MIHKTYTEGVSLEREGPRSSTVITSSCCSKADKSYRTAVTFVPKLIPKRTCFVMDGVLSRASSATYNRSCSLSNGEKSYESSISYDQMLTAEQVEIEDVPFHQNIELVPGLVMKDFSETINNFPREVSHLYNTTFTYDPCHIRQNFVVGLEIDKVREISFTMPEEEWSFYESSMHVILPEDVGCGKSVVNGECDSTSIINGA